MAGEYKPGAMLIRDDDLAFAKAQALPNNTTGDSTNKIDLGGDGVVYSARPLVLDIDLPTVTIAGGKYFDIILEECDTESGSYTEYARIHFAAAEAVAGRKFLGLFNPKRWLKLTYDTTDNLSAKAITAYLSKCQ